MEILLSLLMFCSHAIGLNLSRDWKCDGSVLFEVNSSWADFAVVFICSPKISETRFTSNVT